MGRGTFGYVLFVIIAVIVLASLPSLVEKVNPIYLLVVMIAIGFIWAILRIYMRKVSYLDKEENVKS